MTTPLGESSVLAPAGVQADRIHGLFWAYFDVAALVFVLVLGALVVAIARRRTTLERTERPEEDERPKRRAVTAATTVTAITLVVLLVSSVMTGHAIASLAPAGGIAVSVTGHKWWWEVTYPASVAGHQFTTAYEMHIPVGKPVEVHLDSVDVIHSFWLPSLDGKRDAIPGKKTTLVLQADREGTYEGMCAEFCGAQHANMRFFVVAEPEDKFRAWLAHQLAPAVTPSDPVALAGQQVFEKGRCIACHAISGTDAFATTGPDLTHVASRSALAMGTLDNTTGHLAGWIVDPQSDKPGNLMPGAPLPPDQLQSLLAYLRSLR